jgi:hypothetical protein
MVLFIKKMKDVKLHLFSLKLQLYIYTGTIEVMIVW